MTSRKVIAIGLDGFELSIAEALITAGKMPHLARLREIGRTYLLDHGSARETGLAWEHFSTGKDPDTYARWSAVDFDPATYEARQSPTREMSFAEAIDCPIVAFDVPYMDLRAARNTRGMANWGAHDPGVASHSNPPELAGEIDARFGPYPATDYIYGFVWPSVSATEDMAAQMIGAMQKRTDITSWLLKERLGGWRLAVTVVAELHSVAEALWHGFDTSHPLHGHPSAGPALRGIEGVYVETDRMIGRLAEEHPDADIVAFSMHGMGPNKADLTSMALLPEILYRRRF
ncbi:MAG: alkaline phosphatase family protein, partial [Rubricella sp.]